MAGCLRKTLVIDFDLLVRLHIIPNEHLLFAADQCGTYFDGGEPVDIKVGNCIVREIDGDVSDVFRTVDMLFTRCDYGQGLFRHDMLHDGKIMGR